MDEATDRNLEAQLRQALEPSTEAVERVVRQALDGPRRAAGFRLLPAATVIAALVLAAAVLFQVEPPRRESAVSIESVGELLIVRPREGRISIVRSESGSSPSGTLMVTYGGGE
jgi:hypothetical protein